MYTAIPPAAEAAVLETYRQLQDSFRGRLREKLGDTLIDQLHADAADAVGTAGKLALIGELYPEIYAAKAEIKLRQAFGNVIVNQLYEELAERASA